jgi:hypothetical protein
MAGFTRKVAHSAHRRGGTMIAPSLLMTLVEASRFRASSRRVLFCHRSSADRRQPEERRDLERQKLQLRAA